MSNAPYSRKLVELGEGFPKFWRKDALILYFFSLEDKNVFSENFFKQEVFSFFPLFITIQSEIELIVAIVDFL